MDENIVETPKISQGIEDFTSYLRDTEQKYRIAETNEQEATNDTQAILHYLELTSPEEDEYEKIALTLKEVREKRRIAKDQMDQISPVIQWINTNPNVIKALNQLLGDVRKAENSAVNRIYTPKTKIIDQIKTKK